MHFDAGSLVCGLGDCHTVQASEFATVGPVPVALLGLGMYAAVLCCNCWQWRQPESAFVATTIAFVVTLAGALYALYLTWIEVAVIDAICQWCVASAVLTVALAVVEGIALWRMLAGQDEGQTETGADRAAS